MDIKPKTTQILELSDKDHKVAIITILQDVRESTFEMNIKKIKSFSREVKYFKKKQTETLELQNTINEIFEKFQNGLESRMNMTNERVLELVDRSKKLSNFYIRGGKKKKL